MDEIRDWPEFLNVLKAADEVAGCKVRSEAALTLMFEALSQYSLDDIKRAVAAHIQTSPFAIKPADIVKYLSGSAEDRSVYAWRVFVQALGRYGYYDSVAFPDPAYHFAIIRLGGWEKVSQEYGQLSERE